MPAALAAGLEPILCVGESEAQRDADETAEVLTRQIEADLAGVEAGRLAEVVVAYEPIWAIGTGRTATTEQAQEAIALIRERLAARDAEAAEGVRILYGELGQAGQRGRADRPAGWTARWSAAPAWIPTTSRR